MKKSAKKTAEKSGKASKGPKGAPKPAETSPKPPPAPESASGGSSGSAPLSTTAGPSMSAEDMKAAAVGVETYSAADASYQRTMPRTWIIVTPEKNCRTKPATAEEVRELASNIEEVDLIHPVAVRPYFAPGATTPTANRFELRVGFKRIAALDLLGRTEIPVTVHNWTEAQAEAACIAENVKRGDLSKPEVVAAVYRLTLDTPERKGSTAKEVAVMMQMSASGVSNMIRVKKKLHPDLWTLWAAGAPVGLEDAIRVAGLASSKQAEEWNAIVTAPPKKRGGGKGGRPAGSGNGGGGGGEGGGEGGGGSVVKDPPDNWKTIARERGYPEMWIQGFDSALGLGTCNFAALMKIQHAPGELATGEIKGGAEA